MSSDEYSSSGDEIDNNSYEELLLVMSQFHQTTMQYLYSSSAKNKSNNQSREKSNNARKRKVAHPHTPSHTVIGVNGAIKGSRKMIRGKRETEDSSQSISSVTAKGELTNRDVLMAASIAQQLSSAVQLRINRNIDRRLTTFQIKVKLAAKDVDRWSSFLTPEIINDTDNSIFKLFQESKNKLQLAQDELDDFLTKIDTIEKESDEKNPYLAIVNNALSIIKTGSSDDIITPTAKKRNTSKTPMSSIEIMMDDDDDQYNPVEL